MKLTPLVLHAGVMIPRVTDLFSDRLTVASMVVTSGANVVLTTPSPHGLPIGQRMAISITDADTPNGITAATVNGDGNVVLTTAFQHDMTTTPDPEVFTAWSKLAKLAGFTNPDINGNRQIVDTPNPSTVVITPADTVVSITLTGNEVLLERLEGEIVGWHSVTAASATTLTFPTPSFVTRSYTVANPVVCTSIRVYGALDYDMALSHLMIDDASVRLDRPHMFILPVPVKSRGSGGDLVAGGQVRMIIDDGFTVLVFIPSHQTAAHVRAIDQAQGPIFTAVLSAFHGLKISRSELMGAGNFLASFESHNGAVTKSRAIYAHEYVFAMPAEMTSCDAISPFDWSAINDTALADYVTGSVASVGAPSFRGLDVAGIIHHGHPSPLYGTFTIP